MCYLYEIGMLDGMVDHLVCPGSVVGYMHRLAADLQHGQNVRLQGIADHEELVGRNVEVLDQL